jgi:putative proteasome-type protease
MTYCLSLLCRQGLVFISDSRTSAGVDNINTQAKMRLYTEEGRRVICLLTSGNLSLSQTVVSLIEEDLLRARSEEGHPNLLDRPSMFETARYVGSKIREVSKMDREALEADGFSFNVHFLVGGQIFGQRHETHLVYPQGNTLHGTITSPFLQIGEYKYGKPILDRGFSFDTNLAEAVKFGVISMEGTMKSNVSVGPPLDIFAYEKDTFTVNYRMRVNEGDPYMEQIQERWGTGIAKLVGEMPNISFPVTKVALLVNAPLAAAERVAHLPFIDALQLHGDEDSAFCAAVREFGRPFIKALRVQNPEEFSELAGYETRSFLIDAHVPGLFGGTGVQVNLDLAAEFRRQYPALALILAGGLKPDNVGKAVRCVRPYAVDVSSGVESKSGRKDPSLMISFIAAVREAEAAVESREVKK